MKVLTIIFSFLTLSATAQDTEKDSIAVYIFLLESCPICQQISPTIQEVYNDFKDKGIEFQLIFPNEDYTTSENMVAFLTKYKLQIPSRIDEGKFITTKLKASVTPEVVIIRKKTDTILYRGKIDNSFIYLGKKRRVVNEHYLKDALTQIVNGLNVHLPQTEPVGCLIMKK